MLVVGLLVDLLHQRRYVVLRWAIAIQLQATLETDGSTHDTVEEVQQIGFAGSEPLEDVLGF